MNRNPYWAEIPSRFSSNYAW